MIEASSRRSREGDGSGYGRGNGTHNARLTEVGAGTPCGELFRRYWQPFALTETITQRPQRVRLLGEDLIAFRNTDGRVGLVFEHCTHRGTSLYFGKVEPAGLRCCYHGWLFDVEGNCLEQPCEAGGRFNLTVARQPWYPVEERYGFAWAYLGPPERKPLLPRYDILEDLAPGEMLERDDTSFHVGGGPMTSDDPVVPYNFLQDFENVMDPFHIYVLHSNFTGTQFRREFAVMPEVEWDVFETGVRYVALRKLDDGRTLRRISQVCAPNVRFVPTTELTEGRGNEIAWIVPIDDTHHRTFGIARVREPGLFTRKSRRANHNGKLWSELSDDEHQRFPGDFEAQQSQRQIPHHSEEHLAGSDRGVLMLRRFLLAQIDIVEAGGDPAGVAFDESQAMVEVGSGNYFT
jgi:phenylpropionate dioxygenase-like ring-hydroxylating dioxygenase large terminal subunit